MQIPSLLECAIEKETEKYKILRRLELWEKLLELTLVLPTAA